jgi:hypothetical protein
LAGGDATADTVSGKVPVFTVKVTEFDAPTEVVTTTGPVVALGGTVAIIRKFVHSNVASFVPFNVAVPLEPKFSPMIPMSQFGFTVEGATAKMVGVNEKFTPLLCLFTRTGPDPAKPSGALTTIFIVLQETICASAPLKVTKPGFCPNVPLTVT